MQAGPDKTATWRALTWATLRETFRTRVVARKFVQNVGILTAGNVVGAALNFVQGILVARWLGPELYGVAALVMTYPNLVYGFFDARSVAASVKYLGEYHALGENDRALAMCKLGYAVDLAIACLTFLVVALTARLAAGNIAHDPAVAGLIVLYGAALIPRALSGTSNAILVTLGKFPFVAAIEISISFVRVALIIGLVLGGWQVAGVIWANAVAATVTGFLYGATAWVLIRRAWGGSIFRGRLTALKARRREIFAFLAYNDLNTFIGMIPRQLDTLLLGYFRGPTEVGYYKLAKSISSVVGYLKGPLQSVAYTDLARLWGLSDSRRFSQKVRKLIICIGLPLGLMVLLGGGVMSMALPFLVGESYLPAVGAAQLLFISSAASLAFFWLRPIYLAKGHVRQLFLLNSSVTVAFALVYPFVARQWGYLGSSTWILALNVVGFGVSCSWLWKQSGQEEKPGDAVERSNRTRSLQKTDARLSQSLQKQS